MGIKRSLSNYKRKNSKVNLRISFLFHRNLFICRSEDDLYNQLEQSATSQISDLLLQPVFVCSLFKYHSQKDR
jgi:hypothetical protein